MINTPNHSINKLLIFLLPLLTTSIFAQSEQNQETTNVVPDGFITYDAFEGDLNLDEYQDLIIRFKIENEPDTDEHVYLLLGQKNGTYKLTAKNDNMKHDNIDGVSFRRIVIHNGYFSLEYSGFGNTSGSFKVITFKYSKKDENWILHRIGGHFVHRYFTDEEPDNTMETQQEFDKILFEDF